LRVQLTQTVSQDSTVLLTELRDRWGGSLSLYNKNLSRLAWNWQASAGKGYLFLCDIRPWLLLKVNQADIALEWWTKRPERQRGARGRILSHPPEVHLADKVAAQALKNLKKPIDVVMEDAADLVEVRYTLRQFVNVKGD